jgi:hypothetical protein
MPQFPAFRDVSCWQEYIGLLPRNFDDRLQPNELSVHLEHIQAAGELLIRAALQVTEPWYLDESSPSLQEHKERYSIFKDVFYGVWFSLAESWTHELKSLRAELQLLFQQIHKSLAQIYRGTPLAIFLVDEYGQESVKAGLECMGCHARAPMVFGTGEVAIQGPINRGPFSPFAGRTGVFSDALKRLKPFVDLLISAVRQDELRVEQRLRSVRELSLRPSRHRSEISRKRREAIEKALEVLPRDQVHKHMLENFPELMRGRSRRVPGQGTPTVQRGYMSEKQMWRSYNKSM